MTAAAEPVLADRAPKPPLLTDKQLAALRLAANGASDTQISRRLGIGRPAATGRLGEAYKRLGVHDRAHAVAVALVLGLLRPDEVAVPPSTPRTAPTAALVSPVGLRDAQTATGGPR